MTAAIFPDVVPSYITESPPFTTSLLATMTDLRQAVALHHANRGPMSLAMLREPLPQYASDDQIESLVGTFYARVRTDPELGPIFVRAIGEDWTKHLKTMCDFWSSVMNTTGRYKGKPIPAHLKLPGIEPRHFDRWMQMFSETAQGLFEPGLAGMFVERAARIAESLKLGFAFHAERPEIWGGLPRAGRRLAPSPGTDAPSR